MYSMGPTPSEQKIIIKIYINDLYFNIYCLTLQGNGKIKKDTEWLRIASIKGFQHVRGLIQGRRTNFLPTRDIHDAGGSTFINEDLVNRLIINDHLNEKGNLKR